MPNFELRLNDQLEFQLHLLKIVMQYKIDELDGNKRPLLRMKKITENSLQILPQY